MFHNLEETVSILHTLYLHGINVSTQLTFLASSSSFSARENSSYSPSMPERRQASDVCTTRPSSSPLNTLSFSLRSCASARLVSLRCVSLSIHCATCSESCSLARTMRWCKSASLHRLTIPSKMTSKHEDSIEMVMMVIFVNDMSYVLYVQSPYVQYNQYVQSVL